MFNIIKSYYYKYSIYVILLLLVIITCLLKCRPIVKEVTKEVREPLTTVVLPMPKKKAMSNKSTLPIKSILKQNTTDVVITDTTSVDSVLEYTGEHKVTVNNKPAFIPYSITSTGKVVDFKLGINYTSITKVREPSLKAYVIGNYNLKSDVSVGIGLASPKYLATYTYNPIIKEHNVGVGVKLFTIY